MRSFHPSSLWLPTVGLALTSSASPACLAGSASATPLPTALPATTSYNYLMPALYLNLTVQTVINLGNLTTGGQQLLGNIVDGHLYSEPGFVPNFSASIKYAEDYLTADPLDGVAHPACIMTVFPDNGDTPFLMKIGGIQYPNPSLDGIFSSNTSNTEAIPYGYVYSVWTPTFFGGADNYTNLQNSVFVGSETISGSGQPGTFVVGMKFSKVFNVNTSITIGHEFP
ncbi:hypothetical protein BAUCODRAFT_453035 [Baudoinia panamericana UAMH 10762]|uniref:Uncharacterized protein n=1 Tax=Baudoinia panamericana (strain UAMH 10762) TaxID=717646 RepID=M2NES1_BAUPA|nr:uncharacterized protein BAUCODRAFT_453035 [Baudoinia panamericana UAMH 10762]EMC97460.1 hypothetical protein BAUCODRAFT_453035 [Baudoinia panamericana UAMH 10762]